MAIRDGSNNTTEDKSLVSCEVAAPDNLDILQKFIRSVHWPHSIEKKYRNPSWKYDNYVQIEVS